MDDLAAALGRLTEAFPEDLGPAADPFDVNDLFDNVIYHGNWAVGSDESAFVSLMVSWTPRILRLCIDGQLLGHGGGVPARFVEAGWQGWPPERRAAVDGVLRAWWQATLTTYSSTPPVGAVLVFLTQMTGDVRPWLATWSTTGGPVAARQFRDFMSATLDWSTDIYDFDLDVAEEAIGSWLLRDGIGILSALPPGAELDAGLAELAEWEDRLWWLWWPTDQRG